MSLTITLPARPRLPVHQLAWPLTLWLVLTLLISMLPPVTPRTFPILPAAEAPQLTFTPAAGTAGAIQFSVRSPAGAIGFLPDGLRLALPAAGCAWPFATARGMRPAADGDGEPPACATRPAAPAGLDITFLGAGPDTHIEASGIAAGTTNLLIGADPARWRRDLPGYRELRYEELYPGIDLHYSGRPGALKSVYTVAPGADPASIRWAYRGAADVAIDAASGDLRITLPDGRSLVERAPVAWQERGGVRMPVAVGFVVGGGRREAGGGGASPSVGFAVGAYDPALPLTIDPWLEYGLALGGASQEESYAIKRDAAGNIFIAGYTFSADFAGTDAAPRNDRAAFVSKLAPDGSLIRSLIVDGSGEDSGNDLAIGPDGDVYLAGVTSSPDFPTRDPFQPTKGLAADGFVLRLSNDLSTLRYGTFLGGSSFDYIQGVAIGTDGAIYLSGLTNSADFPVLNTLREPTVEGRCYGGLSDCNDVFISKLSPDGQRLDYSTYYGGSDLEDTAFIAVDAQGRTYVTGHTTSADLLTRNALQPVYAAGSCAAGADPVPCADLYLARLTPAGQLDYATYLGGQSADYTHGGITIDPAGRVYLTGTTFSGDFPTERATQPASGSIGFIGGEPDAFITVVSADGQSLEFSTYLGGTASDGGNGIAVDAAGTVYVTGVTNAADFPLVASLQPTSRNACPLYPNPPFAPTCWDGFLTIINPSAPTVRFSTLLSGSQNDHPHAIAVDPTGGDIYLTGFTTSSDLPLGAISGPGDAFIFKLTEDLIPGAWYVAPGGSDLNNCRAAERACATVGAALARADSGSTIFVEAGTYAENLTITRDVRLIGADEETTIIDGGGRGRVIDIRPGVAATIEGVTVQNGALRLDWAFRDAADLAEGRVGHSATLIHEGVLVAGGCSDATCANPLVSTAVFSVTTSAWRTLAPLNTPRYGHTATRLNDGSVVVIGGYGAGGVPLDSVERYYPDNPDDPDDSPLGRWEVVEPLLELRADHTAVLLHGHEILVVGGVGVAGNDDPLATTAIYSPRTNSWRAAAPLPIGRWYHTMTLLDDGDVLVAGGILGNGNVTDESLRYDPAADSWTLTGPLSTARADHAAALLQGDLAVVDGRATLTEGKVLVAGGPGLASAEIFDPATNSWSPIAPMASPRWLHSLTPLLNGEVLAVGGFDEGLVATGDTGVVPGAEIYSPRTGDWRPAGELVTPRFEHKAVLYGHGEVLVVGGFGASSLPRPGLAEVERWGSSAENLSDYGAGIFVGDEAELTLRDSLVRDNHADLYSGGIWNQGALTLDRAEVRENSAAIGYAGVGNYGGSISLIDSQVRANRSSGSVAGIGSSGGSVSLLRSSVDHNVVMTQISCCGGGAGILTNGLLRIEDSTVNGNSWSGNWGQQHTGGIFLYSSAGRLEMRNSQISNNQVIGTSNWSSYAGGIQLHPQGGDPSGEIVDSEISGNLITTLAIGSQATNGGISVNGGTLILRNTNVLSNTTRNPLGAGGGAGIGNSARLEIYGGAISGNRAEGGSAGGIYSTGTTIISGTLISDNSADYGGGGGIATTGGPLTITGATIRGNRAHQGGGIAASGPLTLTNTLVADNQAVAGLPGETQGGGLWLGSSASLSGVTIRDNSSAGAGGGIYASTSASLTVEGGLVVENSAFAGGGLYLARGAGTTIQGTAISANRAISDTLVRYSPHGGGIFNSGTLRMTASLIDRNQADGGGGAIYQDKPGALTLTGSLVAANSAAASGGGILARADSAVTITASTLRDNRSNALGGAISYGGAPTEQTLTLTNSTLSGNSALDGGAIYTQGVTRLSFSTITNNSATRNTGGIYNNVAAGSTNVTIAGTILAGNSAPASPDLCGPLTSQGNNLIGAVAANCPFASAAGDQAGTVAVPLDPMLAPLADNGGPAPTHAPYPGSPAIDAGGASCPATDQRGVARPQQGRCDVGAVEVKPWSQSSGEFYVATSGSDANDCQSLDTPCRTIRSALARAAAGSTVNVVAGSYREVISIDRDVRIVGAGREATIIDGGGRNLPVVGVIPGVTSTISDLAITGGSVQVPNSNGGGGIYNQGDLTLERVAVRQNRHNGGAGGIGNYGTLVLRDSLVEGNTGAYGGIGNFGTLTVIGSTVARNTAESAGGGITSAVGTTLRIEGGSAISENTAATGGGGIYNNGALSIADSAIEGNTTATGSGGGIYSGGPLDLERVTVRGNRTAMNSGGGGGIAIRNTTSITDSTISENSSRAAGGIWASQGVTLELTNSQVIGNTAYHGAGISTSARTTLRNSAVRENRVLREPGPNPTYGGSAGGIVTDSHLTIIESDISENQIPNAGAGIYIGSTGVVTITRSTLNGNTGHVGVAIFAEASSRLTVDSSTFSGNQANYAGAGILTYGALEITNSTFSGNRAGLTIPGSGSAIFSDGPTSIRFSTIVDNEVVNGSGALVNQNQSRTNPFTIAGSIVAGNRAPFAPDLCNFITSAGHNLIGITATTNECAFAPAAGDQAGTVAAPLVPLLAPLADNGGPTWTHLLRPGSPAIDAGGARCPATDQRGRPRLAGAACDSGAVEWGAAINPGFDPVNETFGFRNSAGRLDLVEFYRDAGIASATHVITRAETIGQIRGETYDMPIRFASDDLIAQLPLTLTLGLETGDGERIIPRPTAWLYEEVIVSRVYEDPTRGDLAGAVRGGRCVGMSVGAAAFKWSGGEIPQTYAPTATIVRELPHNDALLRLIDRFQARQVGLDVLEYQLGPGYHDARSLYRHLRVRMSATDWWDNPEVIGIFNSDGCAEFAVGHALLPYKLELQDDGTARIYVYDSNFPPQPGAAERYITINFATNRWSYQISPAPADDWEGTAIYSVPAETFRQDLRLPYLSSTDTNLDNDLIIAVAGGVHQAMGGRLKGAWGGRLKGAWGGRLKGAWGNDTFVGCLVLPDGTVIYQEQVGRSMRLRPLGGATMPALVVRPPANGGAVTFSGEGAPGDSAGDMLIFGQGGVMGFTSQTSAGRVYSATVDADFHTLTLRTNDRAQPMSAFQMHETPDGAVTRIFAVSNVLIGESDSIAIRVAEDLGSMAISNEGDEPVRITLGLGTIGNEAVGETTRTYVIQPGAENSFTPLRWEDLPSSPIAVEVKPIEGSRVTAGLVARYPFNAGAGTTVADTAPANLAPDLTIADPQAAARWSVDGLTLTAPTMLRASTSSSALTRHLREQGAFTVETWITPAERPTFLGAVLSLGGAGNQSNLVLQYKRSGQSLRFNGRVRIGDTPAGARVNDTPRRPAAAELIHVVMTHDRNGETRIYVDGHLASVTRHRGSLARWDDRFTLTLGNTLAGDRAWLGTYHQVAIYDRALRPGEVRRNFLAGPGEAE